MVWKYAAEYIQYLVLRLLNGHSVVEARLAIQIVSIVSGVATIAVVLWSARKLGCSLFSSWLLALGLLSSGVSLLFFGYIETYPPLIFALTLACMSGVLAAENKLNRLWSIACLLVAIALHPFAVALIPAVFYLQFRTTLSWKKLMSRSLLIRLVLLAMLAVTTVAIVVTIANQSYQIRFMFVQPVADQFTVERYTLFSLSHLADIANLLLMLLPGLLLFLVVAVDGWRSILKHISFRFLGLAIAGSLVVVFVFDPRLGMLRDWDLFAFIGVPISLTYYLLLIDGRVKIVGTRSLAVLSIILGIIVLGARVSVVMSHDRSLNLVRAITNLDHTKSKNLQYILLDYFKDFRHDLDRRDSASKELLNSYPEITIRESALGMQFEGKYGEAISFALRAVAMNPMYFEPYNTLCVSHLRLHQEDRALEYARIECGLNPRAAGAYYDLASVYMSTGDLENSRRYLEVVLTKDSLYGPALGGMAIISLIAGDRSQARGWLYRLDSGTHLEPSYFSDFAQQCLEMNDYSFAAETITLGKQHGLDSSRIARFIRDYPSLAQFYK
jgi:tetratricopeptide (TPR) repeat protein